jgi:hypothetical protein
MVGLVITQPTSWITLTITHHKTNIQGYFVNLVFAILQLVAEAGQQPTKTVDSHRIPLTKSKRIQIPVEIAIQTDMHDPFLTRIDPFVGTQAGSFAASGKKNTSVGGY